ncbi:MAG: class III extradiol ring-cleavage dioxygenase family protein, partial [Desulfitobacterium hafniense]|nr:class III extradiol ring-cleavage dioxygenase family protein [Desulfitobacterium hafniense]
MSLVYSAFVPHPPLIVPEVGHGEEQVCSSTITALQQVVNRIKNSNVETVIVISPHARLVEEGIVVLGSNTLLGDFGNFGTPHVRLSFSNDRQVVDALRSLPDLTVLNEWSLDHGALVPLYFLEKAGWNGKVVLIGMPLQNVQEYGQGLSNVLNQLPQKCALIASGDLSHRLSEDGPYGFDPAGPQFDLAILNALKRNPSEIYNIPDSTIENAGECGFRSLIMALKVREGAVEVLSYEGPFGVGYLVAELYRSSPLPQWARTCLTHHLNSGDMEKLQLPQGDEFLERKGCFVTLKMKGDLRGCIGTTQPLQDNLTSEIMTNTIAAGTEDPRFWPVEKEELKDITFSVDVLGNLEKVEDPAELD